MQWLRALWLLFHFFFSTLATLWINYGRSRPRAVCTSKVCLYVSVCVTVCSAFINFEVWAQCFVLFLGLYGFWVVFFPQAVRLQLYKHTHTEETSTQPCLNHNKRTKWHRTSGVKIRYVWTLWHFKVTEKHEDHAILSQRQGNTFARPHFLQCYTLFNSSLLSLISHHLIVHYNESF